MTLLQAFILGIVQGITEFFPISSSGHLVIVQGIFGIEEPQLAFDIFLHLGTLVSILVYFRKEIINIILKERRIALLLILASLPTVMIGLMFKDAVEELFSRPHLVGYSLLATGLWLIGVSIYSRTTKDKIPKQLGPMNSIIIGVAQGIAVIPGISRSGATIGAGLLSGIDKEAACRFSFLLAIPAILGASLLKFGKISESLTSGNQLYFLVGGITSLVVGIFSIGILLKIVKSDKLYLFGIYCMVAALLIIRLL